MVVRIRLKRLGRRHRPFYRVCAMDGHAPRNGKVIEELGHYDPMIRDTDARAVLNGERIAYWLSVGAQPSDKVGVLIKKYGVEGTHLEQQQVALERLKTEKPQAPPPEAVPKPEEVTPEEGAAAEETSEEAATEEVEALEQLGNCEDRADAHLVGLAARNSKATENAHRLNVVLFGIGAVHDRTDGGAIRKLAGVARGNGAFFCKGWS